MQSPIVFRDIDHIPIKYVWSKIVGFLRGYEESEPNETNITQ